MHENKPFTLQISCNYLSLMDQRMAKGLGQPSTKNNQVSSPKAIQIPFILATYFA